MSGPATTWRLLALLVGLILVDVGVRWSGGSGRGPLPVLEAVDPEAVDGIVVDHGDARVRLERAEGGDGDGWSVVAPYAHPADPAAVAGILSLAEGVRPEGRVGDDGTDFGLEGGEGIRVVLEVDGTALRTLFVGSDAPDGSTYVRLAGSEQVLRARIGGRGRFERPERAWRDPVLWSVDRRRIARIALERADGQRVELTRTPAVGTEAPGPWSMVGAPEWVVDPVLAGAVAQALADWRAQSVFSVDHPGHPEPADGQVTVVLDDGTALDAALKRDGDEGFAAIEGRDGTYAVGGRLVDRLLADAEGWKDRTLWSVDGVRSVEWIGPDGRIKAELDPRTGVWVAREPPGAVVDSRRVGAAAAFLAQPRVERFVEPQAGQGLPGERSVVVVGAQGAKTLQVGATLPGALGGQDAVAVRDPAQPERVGLLEAETAARLGL